MVGTEQMKNTTEINKLFHLQSFDFPSPSVLIPSPSGVVL